MLTISFWRWSMQTFLSAGPALMRPHAIDCSSIMNLCGYTCIYFCIFYGEASKWRHLRIEVKLWLIWSLIPCRGTTWKTCTGDDQWSPSFLSGRQCPPSSGHSWGNLFLGQSGFLFKLDCCAILKAGQTLITMETIQSNQSSYTKVFWEDCFNPAPYHTYDDFINLCM